MEKALGIEVARARLGEIADHARDTGHIIGLTRHGRTVAVIGPANVVKPLEGVEATLLFPAHRDWGGRIPGVPHKGDEFTRDTDHGEENWSVSKVEWYLGDSDRISLYVHLEPGDDRTKRIVTEWEAELRSSRTTEK
jgi:antitoxin (DNA-binding transcriptional repressor) of toxin-antitoxin stability system